MFMHNKRLQYTVRVGSTDPGLANLLLEQFGGPQGELAAAMRYFTQAITEEDPDRKDMLFDIATDELSHLEIIGSTVAMLNRGAKGELAPDAEYADAYYKMSHGAPPERGPWNEGRGLRLVEDPPIPVDGGDGAASVQLSEKERTALDEMKRRLKSDRTHDPETGAELGEG